MTINILTEKQKKQQQKIDAFSELLEDLASSTDKKKILWKEIYENALFDRSSAEILFNEAYTAMQTTTTDHITVGPMLTKYLERMNKSNDQLLKLAELVSRSEENSGKINSEDIFSQISE